MTEPALPSSVPPDVTAVVGRLRAAGCVFAEDEAALLAAEADSPAALEDMVGRRVAGLPLEQIVGWAEFCGRRILLEPGVFVPRRRTELVVRVAAAAVDSTRAMSAARSFSACEPTVPLSVTT